MKWAQRRRQRVQLLVIGALHTAPNSTVLRLAGLTGLSAARIHGAMVTLERDGRVTSRWQDGPYPRRRLYRLAARKPREDA